MCGRGVGGGGREGGGGGRGGGGGGGGGGGMGCLSVMQLESKKRSDIPIYEERKKTEIG